MGIDFKPKNALEQAIHDHDPERMVYAVAERNPLTTLAPASNLGYECFPDEVIFSVLLVSATQTQLETMADGWFWGHLRAGERLRRLVEEALLPLPQEPSEAEKKLIRAAVLHDNGEILRLIKEEKVRFHGFSPELLILLPELSKEAVLALLQDGLSAKLKAIVLRMFLNETEKPDMFHSFSYAERCKYANVMIKLIAGKSVSADEPWYPEDPNSGKEKPLFP